MTYLSLSHMRLSVYSVFLCKVGVGLVLDGLLCDCYLSLSHMRLSVYSYVRCGFCERFSSRRTAM